MDREKVVRDLRYLKSFGRVSSNPQITEIAEYALAMLKEQETVEHACEILRSNGWTETEPICSECDAIHVVRCKDCIHADDFDCPAPLPTGYSCQKGHGTHTGDWYCADGKRKKYK